MSRVRAMSLSHQMGKSELVLGRLGFAHPAIERRVVVNPAKLELTLHAPQFRIGDRFNHAFQIAANAAQCRAPATVRSADAAEAVAAERRPIFIVAGRTAISIVAGQIVSHLRTPYRLVRAVGAKMPLKA